MGFKEDLGEFADKVEFENPQDLAKAYVDLSSKTWLDDLGDLKDHEKLKDAKLEDVVKGYIEAPSAREIPEKPEDYKIPEGFKVKGFRKFAHETGLTQAEVDKVLEFNQGKVKAAMEKAQELQAAEEAELKKEWGDDVEKNTKISEDAIAFFDDENNTLKTFLENSKASGRLVVKKLFHKIGTMLKEDGYLKSEDNTKGTKKTLADRLYPNHGK
jgi:hypothetical protein